MRSIELALQGAASVLFAGLIFGAGLPVVYALAMRALVTGSTETEDASGHTTVHHTVLGRAVAGALLAVIVGAVALGITMIAASGFGKTVSFSGDGILPTIVDK